MIAAFRSLLKRFERRMRYRPRNPHKNYSGPGALPMEPSAFARKITACPEFSMLEFDPRAGQIDRDKQYLFDVWSYAL